MVPLLIECAVRALLMAIGTAVVLWVMRIRSAATRHAGWTAVVIAMLLLPMWSMVGAPRMSLRVLRPQPSPIEIVAGPTNRASAAAGPLDTIRPEATAATQAVRVDWRDVVAGIYLLGVCLLLARLAVGTVQAHRLRRGAVSVAGRATSGLCAAPITVGWFAPVLILPSAWPRWPGAQLDAVLTHEAEHARRRDPLVQWLALFNRAVFWFHPLAWWLERRLAILAEEACDAAVLAAGHSPQDYSEYLLDLARSITREGRRINVVGTAMPGSGLTRRMRQILDGMPRQSTSRRRVACTVALCVMSSIVFTAATLTARSPQDLSQESQRAAFAATQKFDVVSVKPCDPKTTPAGRRGAGGDTSPGRLHVDCQNLLNLIHSAYLTYANGRLNPPWTLPTLISSAAPDWTKSDRFTIEGKADGLLPAAVMWGPMLRAVLEDRFKLETHRETREVPIYELVVAKKGSKLTPFRPGSCVPFDWTSYPPPPLEPGLRRCSNRTERGDNNSWVYTAEAVTLDDVATGLDRPVVNQTGITGLVAYRLVVPDNPDWLPGDPPSFGTALKEQLGLELRPSRGPRDFLIIDRVERPTLNNGGLIPAARGPGAGK